ncbi:hypothetical protein [Paenibacillus harenae]|uniref:Uncharacterized protein n=1 Tax=Paenibacillus harenae TaxID=306543 RepID=A0ABT9U7W5_PAEHA|nr:hypothetical protein [Paenibacillus harenae]MDQ0114309.1 hypothetical protein [Paenibacillus harenae]
MSGKVSVWKLTPEQVEVYTPGMELGTPDKIEDPPRPQLKFYEEEERKSRQLRGIKSKTKGKTILTEELFLQHRAAGMRMSEIEA